MKAYDGAKIFAAALAGLCVMSRAHAFWDEDRFAAACATVKDHRVSAAEQPTAADRARYANKDNCETFGYTFLLDEDSEDLIDAHRCWLTTDSSPLGLALVFANGWGGTAPDYDASLHFLCKADLNEEMIAPAELWGMAEAVQDMRDGSAPKTLTYCAHVTSGRGALFCEDVEASRREQARQPRLDALEKGLDADARAAFVALAKATDAFVDKDGEMREYDSRGGTGHPSMQLAAETALKDDFAAMLERRAAQRAPSASAAEFTRVDRELNLAYKQLVARTEPCPLCGERHEFPAVARDAQRAWLAYRDAWIAFYVARWKGAAPAAVLQREVSAELERSRAADLRKIAQGEGD